MTHTGEQDSTQQAKRTEEKGQPMDVNKVTGIKLTGVDPISKAIGSGRSNDSNDGGMSKSKVCSLSHFHFLEKFIN